ncbi:PaaI family thioesterase [Corynebacterium sp.]|uniref:PaaI family thioesterase n=1 Tax=Corynebacterium sp. TaxID=1720 RepID=UPI0026DC91A4|nr:PaaI family thioesterase [Corynebacterium sp.]MDO4609301.1 PaaI family thioesterase [Corynebacterium sp.]
MADQAVFDTYMSLLRTAAERELEESEIARVNAVAAEGGVDGLGELLGTTLRALGPRGATMAFTADSRHLQPWGLVNGGVFAAVGESLGSMSGYLAAGAGPAVVGANNSTDFFRPGSAGMTVVSVAEPVHLGRTSHVWEIRHSDEATGKLLARTTLRLAVLPRA